MHSKSALFLHLSRHQPHLGLRASGEAIKRRTRAGNRRTNLCTLLHLFSAINSLSTKSYIDILRDQLHKIFTLYMYIHAPHHPFDWNISSLLLHFSFFKSRGIRLRQTLFSIATIDRLRCLHNSDSVSVCFDSRYAGQKWSQFPGFGCILWSNPSTSFHTSTFHDFSPCFT